MYKISPIKERILQIIEFLGITKVVFCEKTKISYANLKGKSLESEIGGDKIAEILSIYNNISPEWLLTGKGEMLRTQSTQHTHNNDTQSAEKQHKDKQNKSVAKENNDHFPAVGKMIPEQASEGIPLIPTSAMAGIFQGETIVLEYECDKYIVPAFKDAEFLISVKGSSMIPKYNSGDIVACKRMPLDTFFQWNKVYVLDTEQGALIKRVKRGSTDETLSICSDNPSYEPFELSRNKIYHIALVIGVIRLE